MAPSKKNLTAVSNSSRWTRSIHRATEASMSTSKTISARSSKCTRSTRHEAPFNLEGQGQNYTTGVQSRAPLPTLTTEQFADALRARELPTSLSGGLLDRFRSNVLSVVEGLYRDRIAATLGEVQKRLRRSGWGTYDVQAVLPVCAREPSTYEFVLPTAEHPLQILLCSQPPGLHGWIDADMAPDTYPAHVWAELHDALKAVLEGAKYNNPNASIQGGCQSLASSLQRHLGNCSTSCREYTLGELLHIIKLSLAGHAGFLKYDEQHGGRLQIKPDTLGCCAEVNVFTTDQGPGCNDLSENTSKVESLSASAPLEALATGKAHATGPSTRYMAKQQVTSAPEKAPTLSELRYAPTPARGQISAEPREPETEPKVTSRQRAAAKLAPRLVNKPLTKPDQTPKDSIAEDQKVSPRINDCGINVLESGPEERIELVLQSLRQQPLPEEFLRDDETLRKCKAALHNCVESLYRDCIKPTMAEIHLRLSKSGWVVNQLQGALLLSVRDPDQYHIEIPQDGSPLCVLLRSPPIWFDGWTSSDSDEGLERELNADVCEAFLELQRSLKDQEVCSDVDLVLDGTIQGAAADLRQLALPQLHHLSLGEVREVVRDLTENGYLEYKGRQLHLVKEAFASEQSESEGLSDDQYCSGEWMACQ